MYGFVLFFVIFCSFVTLMERDIERRLKTLVKLAGGVCYKIDSRPQRGVPDRVVVLPDRGTFLVELKTESGRLSPTQVVEIERARDAGASVRVLYGMRAVESFVNG